MAKKTDEIKLKHGLVVEIKETTPPQRYTEATLIKALQQTGIGRPSTFATIVDTLLSTSRGYCTLDGKSITPLNRGMQLSAFLDRAFPNLININYTKEMEESLDKIATGKLDKLEFLNKFFKNLEESINNNTEHTNTVSAEKPCPDCGGVLCIRRSKLGKLFWGCKNFPKCRHTESVTKEDLQ